MKSQHPATMFKKHREPIVISQEEPVNTQNKRLVGRRTGMVVDEKVANGKDYLFKDDFTDILGGDKNIMDLYYSDDDSDSDDEGDDDVEDWPDDESESEAEESLLKDDSLPNNRVNNNINSNVNNANRDTSKRKFSQSRFMDPKEVQRVLKEEPDDLPDFNKIPEKRIDLYDDDDDDDDDDDEDHDASSPTFNKTSKKIKVEPVSNLKNRSSVKSQAVSSKNNFMKGVTNNKEGDVKDTDMIKVESNQSQKKLSKERDEYIEKRDDNFDLSFDNLNQSDHNNKFGGNSTPVKRNILNSSISTIKKKEDITNILTDNELLDIGLSKKKNNRKSQITDPSLKINNNIENINNNRKSIGEVDKGNNAKNNIKADENVKNGIVKKNSQEKNKLKKSDKVKNQPKLIIEEENEYEPDEPFDLEQQIEKHNEVDIDKKEKSAKDKIKVEEKQNSQENQKDKKKRKRKYDEMAKENNEKVSDGVMMKKGTKGKKIPVTESQFIKESYMRMLDSKAQFRPIDNRGEREYFGVNNRYSKRIRIPRLNPLAGERLNYSMVKNPYLNIFIPHLTGVTTADNQLKTFQKEKTIIKKTKRLVKSLKHEENKELEEENEKDDLNLDKLIQLPEYYSEEDDDNEDGIVKIYPNSQKGVTRNLQVHLRCKVLSSKGNNLILVGQDKMKNMKVGAQFTIPPLTDFNFFNMASEDLRISLSVDK